MPHTLIRPLLRGLGCAVAMAAITALDDRLHVNPTTVALSFLIAVLAISAYWGLWLAVATSVAATLAFNFFFLPPRGTLRIADTQNWIALAAFLLTALLASNLAERARHEAAKALQAETARRQDQLRAALLDSVTHEFRTPLTGIKAGVTALLSDAPLDAAQRCELLTVIDEEADQLDRLIGEAAEVAQLEARMIKLDRHPTAVDDLVRSTIAAAEPLLQAHPVHVDIASDLPALTIDAERIGRALRQLLENAAKYSPAGAAIRVSAALHAGKIKIEVADSGPGVEEAERHLIFQKFYRGHSQRYSARGTGMGLAIAKVLVEAHGGEIGVRSEAQHGSVFYIELAVPAPMNAAREQS